MKKIFFPYKIYKKESYPIIKILMEGPDGPLETEAYVDTGASISIFQTAIASDLGIDYSKGKVSYTMVGDGGFIPVYVHTIPMRIGHVRFPARIGFSPSLGADFNLLGQKDIFDRFVVSFDRRKKIVSFQPYRRQ
ncbi:MAG: retropepsin-like aspartic protease [Candidatus Margulisiibacteriota bacterium]